MAQPLLDFLVGRARQALPFLRAAAARGLSATAALNELRSLNLGFQRQRVLDVYAALLGRIDPERLARLVGQAVPLPAELHTVAPVNLNSNYQYVVGAFDAEGEPLGHVTISSNIPLASVQIRGQAEILFTDQAELYLEEGALSVAAVSIVEANKSPSAP